MIEGLQSTTETGHLLLVGIDQYGKEIAVSLSPCVVVTSFQYVCTSKFDIDIIKRYYQPQRTTGNCFVLMHICGAHAKLYMVSLTQTNNNNDRLDVKLNNFDGKSNRDVQFQLVTTVVGHLLKRHSNGGQSSVRMARLADDSRHQFIVRSFDALQKFKSNTNLSCSMTADRKKGNNKLPLLVVGSTEVKNLLCLYKPLLDHWNPIVIDSNCD